MRTAASLAAGHAGPVAPAGAAGHADHAGPVRIHPAPDLGRRIRSLGTALLTWARGLGRRPLTREELAWRHERRIEAERLRDEHVLHVMTRSF